MGKYNRRLGFFSNSLSTLLFLLLLVILIFFLYYVINTQQQQTRFQQQQMQFQQQQLPKIQKKPTVGILNNPYTAPLVDNRINIRTQGEPSKYTTIGILTRLGDVESTLPLIGRSINRNNWNYYTINDKNSSLLLKLPIYNTNNKNCLSEYGCQMLNDGDIVKIEGTDATFKVTTYDNAEARYLPNVF
jgi:hypothetical protein